MKIDKDILCRTISQKEVEDIFQKEAYLQKWLRKKSEVTKRSYIRNLLRYMETLLANEIIKTMNVDELFKLAEEKIHVDTLIDFQDSADQIFPENERSLVFALSIAIKSFYSHKSKVYAFAKSEGEYFFLEKKTKRIPKLNDIMPYMNTIPHLRDRMIVALESSTAIRLGSLVKLKWIQFKEVLENREIPSIILKHEILKGYSSAKYSHVLQICFLSPLAKSYVMQWLEEYQRLTHSKIDLNDEESLQKPFLISIEGETKGKALTYSALNSRFNTYKTFNLHAFRTFCNEGYKRADISREDRDLFLGHSLGKLEIAYSEHDTERLRQEFKRAIKYLDYTFKEDEGILRVKKASLEVLNRELSDEEAKKIFEKVVIKFFKGEG